MLSCMTFSISTCVIGVTIGLMHSTFLTHTSPPTFVQCEYVAWVTRRRYRFVQVRCPLFDEVLFTLWDHYYVFAFGSIRELTTSHTLVTEQFCLLYPAVFPERNRDRLFNEYAARV